MHRLAPPLLALAALVSPLVAQDPGLDLPHLREPGVPAEQRMPAIGARLVAGWDWEAARLCRELTTADPDAPLPYALLALAMGGEPNRAARLCWQAVSRRAQGAPVEQQLVDALQRYFGVEQQPELVDERYAAAPPPPRRQQLAADLTALAAANDGAPWIEDLARAVRRRGDAPAAAAPADLLGSHNAYLAARRAMPFEVPGYAALLSDHLPAGAERERWLARLPRHPDYAAGRPVGRLPGFAATAAPLWRPQAATKFTLTSGFGGSATFDPAAGQPTLVVFFLGFGCAHCVAQLKDLDPKAETFRAAGIEVVSVGTDTLQQVRAAQQAARENGVDPLHFDVLCDPQGDVFKRWNVWDEFADEALHGTFLVDGKGRVLWQDISERPFEQSDWLLAECRRLLQAWR